MAIDDIAAVLITRDAGETLRSCLESLRPFPEVVVYDNGSTDDTLSIAGEFANARVHQGEFLGFGPTKNYAVGLAAHDWVFSIDADESVTPELISSLDAADLSDSGIAFQVNRHNYFMGRHVHRGGWGDDWLLRVFHRRRCAFNDAAVHEKVVPDSGVTIRRLDGVLKHAAVREVSQFLVKINRYSELYRRSGQRTYSLPVIVIRAWWAFIKSYFIKGGILDGWRGLVIARSNANGVFYKYMKTYADRTKRSE